MMECKTLLLHLDVVKALLSQHLDLRPASIHDLDASDLGFSHRQSDLPFHTASGRLGSCHPVRSPEKQCNRPLQVLAVFKCNTREHTITAQSPKPGRAKLSRIFGHSPLAQNGQPLASCGALIPGAKACTLDASDSNGQWR